MKKFITVNDARIYRTIRINIDKIVAYWAHGDSTMLDIESYSGGMLVDESVEEIDRMIEEATKMTITYGEE